MVVYRKKKKNRGSSDGHFRLSESRDQIPRSCDEWMKNKEGVSFSIHVF
jgi:hypothetical protein